MCTVKRTLIARAMVWALGQCFLNKHMPLACHQHIYSARFDLNPGQWQHFSVQSRVCPCHCYKGSTEGNSDGGPVQASVERNLLRKFVATNENIVGTLYTWFK